MPESISSFIISGLSISFLFISLFKRDGGADKKNEHDDGYYAPHMIFSKMGF